MMFELDAQLSSVPPVLHLSLSVSVHLLLPSKDAGRAANVMPAVAAREVWCHRQVIICIILSL